MHAYYSVKHPNQEFSMPTETLHKIINKVLIVGLLVLKKKCRQTIFASVHIVEMNFCYLRINLVGKTLLRNLLFAPDSGGALLSPLRTEVEVYIVICLKKSS